MIGALIGAIASVAGAGITAAGSAVASKKNREATKDANDTNLQIVRETNQANKELAIQQNQWNIDQWNREVTYNDPSSQVARLRAAGLSAAGAAQGVNNIASPQLQSVNLANQQTGNPMIPETRDMSWISGMNLASIGNLVMDIIGKDLDNQGKVIENNFKPQQIISEVDARNAATALSLQQFKHVADEHPYKLETLKYNASSARWEPKIKEFAFKLQKANYQSAKYTFKNVTPLKVEQLRKELMQMDLDYQGKALDNQGKALDNQGKALDNQGKALDNQGKALDNQSKELEISFKKSGMPDDAAGRMAALISDGKMSFKEADNFLENILNYLHSGGKVFSSQPGQVEYFNHIINPGINKFFDFDISKWPGIGAYNLSRPILDEFSGSKEFYDKLEQTRSKIRNNNNKGKGSGYAGKNYY